MEKKKFITAAAALCLAALAAALIVRPERYIAACFEGICLWGESVLPSLLPFMIINLLITNMGVWEIILRQKDDNPQRGKLTKYSLPLIIMSAVSGYPAGSRLICEYYRAGLITKDDAQILSPICSCCSPLFALGTVGVKAFGNGTYGLVLLLAAYISALLVWPIYIRIKKPKRESIHGELFKSRQNVLESSFYGAVTACLTAGAFICFFYTASKVIDDFAIFMPLKKLLTPILGDCTEGLLSGLIEATGGCFAIAATGNKLALPLCTFLCVFGGASVLLQQLCYLSPCKVKTWEFVLIKFIQGTAAAFICAALQCLI